MSKTVGFDVPEDMLSFWNACLMIYSEKHISKEKEDEITKNTGFPRSQIFSIKAWLEKLPEDIKANTLGAGRFDLFETAVLQLLLTDNIAIANKKLKSLLADVKDVNTLASSMGTMLNKWEMLKDVFMQHKNQSGRADTVRTPVQKYEDNVPEIIRFKKAEAE